MGKGAGSIAGFSAQSNIKCSNILRAEAHGTRLKTRNLSSHERQSNDNILRNSYKLGPAPTHQQLNKIYSIAMYSP